MSCCVYFLDYLHIVVLIFQVPQSTYLLIYCILYSITKKNVFQHSILKKEISSAAAAVSIATIYNWSKLQLFYTNITEQIGGMACRTRCSLKFFLGF
jgi:hypothetical protein